MTGSQLSSTFSGITLYQRRKPPRNTRQVHLSDHSLSQKVNAGTQQSSWLAEEGAIPQRQKILPPIALKIEVSQQSLILTCSFVLTMVPFSPLSCSLGFSCTRKRGWLERFMRKESAGGVLCTAGAFPWAPRSRLTWKNCVTEACSCLQLAAFFV